MQSGTKTKILACFSLNIWPFNEDLFKNVSQILEKVPYFLKMTVFDTLNAIHKFLFNA